MTTKQSERQLLKVLVKERLALDRFLKELKRGGAYLPLFARHEERTEREERLIWLNSWVLTTESKDDLERRQTVQTAGYFQDAFHPALWTSGSDSRRFGYEPLYGRGEEPLVLGWSSDGNSIDATLSQEFERFYRLTPVHDRKGTRWNSQEKAVDDVVVREMENQLGSVIAQADFVRDFQDVRQRWLLVAYWAQWQRGGFRDHIEPDDRVWAVRRRRSVHRTKYFGLLTADRNDVDYIEVHGYELYAPPRKAQFSRSRSATPKSVEAVARQVVFQTSNGSVRVSRVDSERYQSPDFNARVIFDQEVLQKYQDEGAKITVDNICSLSIHGRKLSVSRMVWILGTEYVSATLGYLVEGVPKTEWGHWQKFNRPWVGSSPHRKLMEEPSLYVYARDLERLPMDLNEDVRPAFPGVDNLPFRTTHPTDKDLAQVVRALPRHAGLQELLHRAQALDSVVVQRLSAAHLRTALVKWKYNPPGIAKMGPLTLFTAFMAILAVAHRALGWCDWGKATQHAVGTFQEWGASRVAADEDTALVVATVQRMEPLFGVNKLRIQSAHPSATDARAILMKYFGLDVRSSNYRDAIIAVYRAVPPCLAPVREW